MKVTFILKDLSDIFYNGGGFSKSVGLNNMTNKDKFSYLTSSHAKDLNITSKIGNGSFRDRVELNQLLRNNSISFDYKIESRRGYKLVTFEIK